MYNENRDKWRSEKQSDDFTQLQDKTFLERNDKLMADLVVLEMKLHGFSTAIKKAEDKEARH